MAIDFGRAAQGIATGYLQAKIRNTEANDALKANTLMRVGETLIGETIPNAIEAEKVRRTNYDNLVGEFGVPFAEVADINRFTVDDASMKALREKLEKSEINKEALKDANFATDYNTRYNTRVESAQSKYGDILKQLGGDGIGALGYNTVEALVKPQAMDTITTKDMQTDTVTTQEVPKAFSSTVLQDYLDPMKVSYQVDSKKFAAAAQPFGFQGSISFDASGEPIFNLPGTLNTKYRALFAATNDVSSQFLDQDNNVNVGLATEAGSKKLYLQTEDTINNITKNYTQVANKGIIESTAEGFTDDFNTKLPSDKDKKDALKQHLIQVLGSKSEQQYFAESFPVGVKFSNGQEVKEYLLNLTNRLK